MPSPPRRSEKTLKPCPAAHLATAFNRILLTQQNFIASILIEAYLWVPDPVFYRENAWTGRGILFGLVDKIVCK